ncbi:hypothetical protein DUNSADRAFT_3067, partial [Dunaliella salina]
MIRLYPPLLVALLLPVLGEGARGLGLGHTHATSRSPTSNDLDTRSGDTQFPAMHSSFAFPSTDASLSRRKLRDKTSLGMAAQRHLLNHMQGTPPASARGAPARARQTWAQPGPSPSMATSKVTAESTNPTVLGDDGIGVSTSNPISVSNPITVKSPSSSASGGGGLGGGGLLSSLLAGTAGGVAGGMASGPLPLPFGRRM